MHNQYGLGKNLGKLESTRQQALFDRLRDDRESSVWVREEFGYLNWDQQDKKLCFIGHEAIVYHHSLPTLRKSERKTSAYSERQKGKHY